VQCLLRTKERVILPIKWKQADFRKAAAFEVDRKVLTWEEVVVRTFHG
jgi:hypothetical protein